MPQSYPDFCPFSSLRAFFAQLDDHPHLRIIRRDVSLEVPTECATRLKKNRAEKEAFAIEADFFHDALHENPKTFPSLFVPCSYHLLEIWIERGQTSQTTGDEPIGLPETTKNANVFVQPLRGFRTTERRS